jgi:hypothetical protein
MWLLKISLVLVDSLLKVGPGKTKKILEKSLKSHGIFSQKRCMNPDIGTRYRGKVFFDPSDSYFLFAEERGYRKWALAHSPSCYLLIYY